jgi:hypothetical protein
MQSFIDKLAKSNAGLIRDQRYRTDHDAGMQPTTGQNAVAGKARNNFFSAFPHLHMICQHHKAGLTPSAAVYGHAGCISLHRQSVDEQGVPHSSFIQFLKIPECPTVQHPVSPKVFLIVFGKPWHRHFLVIFSQIKF